MTTPITDAERALSQQIDEQGGQLAAWRDRAIAAEAELARLRAVEPVAWVDVKDRHEGPYEFHGMALLDSGKHHLYAAPPAQPARCRYCDGTGDVHGIDGEWRGECTECKAAQPAEPVQRLSDERAAFEAWHNEYRTQELVRRDDTYYNTHVRCRWEGWQARAIESALQPGWRDIETPPGWKLVPICLTPEMREVLLMADRFTVGEVYIMLLAAAPKGTP